MESAILQTTNFNMQVPTLHQFTSLALQHYRLEHDPVLAQLARLSMFDFMLSNRFQKQHLSAVILYFSLKLN